MGIRVFCPNGHRLNLKSHLAGKQGICPHCGMTVAIPPLDKAEELGMLKNPRTAGREKSVVAGAYGSNGSNGSAVGVVEPQTRKSPRTDAACEPNLASPYARGNGSASNGATANGTGAPAYDERPTSSLDDGGIEIGGKSEVSENPSRRSSSTSNPASQPAVVASAPVAAEVDPIAENPQAVWYVRTPQGGQYGPAAGDIMRKWIAEGRVQADFWVWREGWTDWQKASDSIPSLKKAAVMPAAAPLAAPASPAAAGSDTTSRASVAAPSNGYAAFATPANDPAPAKRGNRSRRRGIHPLAILAVVGLGLVCLALLGVLIAMLAGAL